MPLIILRFTASEVKRHRVSLWLPKLARANDSMASRVDAYTAELGYALSLPDYVIAIKILDKED